MSVHFWGENPVGEWTLEIHDNGPVEDTLGQVSSVSSHRTRATTENKLTAWALVLHGTADSPQQGWSPEVQAEIIGSPNRERVSNLEQPASPVFTTIERRGPR